MKRADEVVDGGVAVVAILGQRSHDRLLDVVGKVGDLLTQRRRIGSNLQHQHFRRRLGGKGRHTRQHLVHDDSQGVDVRAQVHVQAVTTLLGRHIRGAAHDDPGTRLDGAARAASVLDFGDAEIQHLDPLAPRRAGVGHQEQVLGF